MAEEDFEDALGLGHIHPVCGEEQLQLSNPDFYSFTSPLGDEDKRRCHFGGVTANRFQCLDRKVCLNMSRAEIDDPNEFSAKHSHSPKVAVVRQNHSP